MRRQELPSLLLLPWPPNPADRQALSAAYRPPLAGALTRLRRPDRASKLIVAVPCRLLQGQSLGTKTFSWTAAQSIVAGIYSIIALICAQLSIASDMAAGPGSVEATVILVDYDHENQLLSDFRPAIEPNNTVIIDLTTFSAAYGPWDFLFQVTSEPGLQLSQTYLRLFEGRQILLQEQFVPVDGGLTLRTADLGCASQESQTRTRPIVCLGGTFDHLHVGHKLLLTAGAFLLKIPHNGPQNPAQFIIGITGDEMLRNKKFADFVESWDSRAGNVLIFLSTLLGLPPPDGWKSLLSPNIDEKEGELSASFRQGRIIVRCVKIQDAFGPTITIEGIDVLVVSGETSSGAKAVNDKRESQGWHKLDVFEVDVLNAEEVANKLGQSTDFTTKISSTAIREQRAKVSNGVANA